MKVNQKVRFDLSPEDQEVYSKTGVEDELDISSLSRHGLIHYI